MAKIVTFGEIMLRLATPGHLRFSQTHEFEATFGGGEANVAVSLSNYGEDAHFVTALPDNDIAKACLAELRGRYGDRHRRNGRRYQFNDNAEIRRRIVRLVR